MRREPWLQRVQVRHAISGAGSARHRGRLCPGERSLVPGVQPCVGVRHLRPPPGQHASILWGVEYNWADQPGGRQVAALPFHDVHVPTETPSQRQQLDDSDSQLLILTLPGKLSPSICKMHPCILRDLSGAQRTGLAGIVLETSTAGSPAAVVPSAWFSHVPLAAPPPPASKPPPPHKPPPPPPPHKPPPPTHKPPPSDKPPLPPPPVKMAPPLPPECALCLYVCSFAARV